METRPMKNFILLLFALGLSFSLFGQSNWNGISYQALITSPVYVASDGSDGTSSELLINGELYVTASGGGKGFGAFNNQGQAHANTGASSTSFGSATYSNSADDFHSMVILENNTFSQTPSVLIKH